MAYVFIFHNRLAPEKCDRERVKATTTKMNPAAANTTAPVYNGSNHIMSLGSANKKKENGEPYSHPQPFASRGP